MRKQTTNTYVKIVECIKYEQASHTMAQMLLDKSTNVEMEKNEDY